MFHILDFLFPPRTDDLMLRDISDDQFRAMLNPVPVTKTHPETIALFPFAEPAVRAAIHEAKYHGSRRAFGIFAEALADFVRDSDERGTRAELIPLPLGTARRKERGFNQTEEVMRRASNECGIPLACDRLMRTRETESQTSLTREKRQENMRGAFRSPHPLDPHTIYTLVDDVITTGATMQAAIDALTEAGALHILPIALAH